MDSGLKDRHTVDDSDLGRVAALVHAVTSEVQKGFIGPASVTETLLLAVVARGHVLLEGVPGVAKTTLVKTFAQTLGCTFRRIQFTPDLLPSDITGTQVLDVSTGRFSLREGPVFAQVVLGDEINRAPAKTQSALLEAMQEGQVTIDGETRPLTPPFLVLATQNPLEQEGTYPLPEAQIDRFLVKMHVHYPTAADEKRMLASHAGAAPVIRAVLTPADVLRLQELADTVHAEDAILDYVLALAHFTRRHPRILLGASPRAALSLLRASKARALLAGRAFVLPDDVKSLAAHVFAHRLLLSPESELEGIAAHALIAEAVDATPYRNG